MSDHLVDNIFLDLDDTLFSTTDFVARARGESVKAMIAAGLPMSPEKAMAELEQVIAEFGSNFSQHYDLLLERMPQSELGGLNRSLVVAAGVAAYHDTKFRHLAPFEDAVRTLERIRESRDVRIGIISSGIPAKQAEKLVRLGLPAYIDTDAVFFAEEIGYSKFNPNLYRKIARVLGVRPESILYVGDHPLRDIDPANAAGYITVQMKRGGRHSALRGQTSPDHVVRDYDQLWSILVDKYGFRDVNGNG